MLIIRARAKVEAQPALEKPLAEQSKQARTRFWVWSD
jgi:hypothetical protein